MLNAIIEMITINILSIYNFALKCNMVINELIEINLRVDLVVCSRLYIIMFVVEYVIKSWNRDFVSLFRLNIVYGYHDERLKS